jgi:hypothetical protein
MDCLNSSIACLSLINDFTLALEVHTARSSARIWQRSAKDDEPLTVDFDRIAWRRA